jgi:hypothetical protein
VRVPLREALAGKAGELLPSSRRQRAALATALVPDLGQEPLEALLGRVVHERHRRGDARVHGRDGAAHLVRDRTVRGMPFPAGPELHQVQRLARVELEDVPDAKGEAESVRRLVGKAGVAQALVFRARDVERAFELAGEARLDELVRDVGAEAR